MNIPVTSFTLLYNGKDISADISNQVLSIEYDDKIKGQTDEIQITVEDTDQRWQNNWYPQKGDTLQLIIRSANQQLNCGVFTIDENEGAGSTDGDIFSFKAMAASPSKRMRTKISYAHENKSLAEIAKTVADNLGLTVQGNIKDITFGRKHQYRETDLNFLNRIGSEYGYIFSVRGSLLVFAYYQDIEGRPASLTLGKKDLVRWNIKDSTHLIYRNGRIRYHVAKNKKVIDYSAETEDEFDTPSEDDMELYSRIENDQQAQTKVAFGLHDNNSNMMAGEISTQGNLLILSGNNVQLQGIGNFSGIYNIIDSHHSISRESGYHTSANLKRVKTIDKSLYK